MSAATSWKPAPVLDPEMVAAHLDRHGVFDAADAEYDAIERGETGDIMSPDEVRVWLAERGV